MGEVDIENIPPENINTMARNILAAVQNFYSNEENQRKFEEWERKRKQTA